MSMPILPDDAIDADLQMRLGRNLVVFQRIEANLKQMMAANRLAFHLPLGADAAGTQAALESDLAHQRKKAGKRNKANLGMLVGDYLDEVVAGKEPPPGPDRPDCISLTFSFRLEKPDGAIQTDRERLAAMVEERNALVHHFLERLVPLTPESQQAARVWLDAQHARALVLLQELRSHNTALAEGRQAHLAYLRSPEFGHHFEHAWLLDSPLVQAFATMAEQAARTDGWVVYDNARRIIRENLPDALDRLQDRYGHAKLIDVLRATGVFEFHEEPTSRGGRRLLYRLVPPPA